MVKFGSPAHPLRLVQGEEIASLFLQPIPGSDLALFVGIQKVLLERGWVRYDYLQAYTEHQRVSVRGDAGGQLDGIEIIFGAVRSGAAPMFYPEANGLMKARIEPRSGTPAYKRVQVAVFAAT